MNQLPECLVLDSEGLTKAAARGSSVRARLEAAERIEAEVAVSAVTLAEVLRGHPRDAAVHLLLKSCRVEPVDARIGRAAGELLGQTGLKDTIDAVVIVTAATLPSPVVVLTSDPTDLTALAEGFPGIHVEAV